MDERDRLFFEHDVATPITNLKGALYLLVQGSAESEEEAEETLDILEGNIHALQRMLHWYYQVRKLEEGVDPDPPWAFSTLCEDLVRTLEEERVGLPGPGAEAPLAGRCTVPKGLLAAALIGASVTLSAASDRVPEWRLESVAGVVESTWAVEGHRSTLDPERLFRKYTWPARPRLTDRLDAGLPFLDALIRPFGGSLELEWRGSRWILAASIPSLRD